jgi:hypothetical protein
MEDDAYTVSLDSKRPIDNRSGAVFGARDQSIRRFDFFPKPFRRNRFIEAGPDTGLTASGVKRSVTSTERFRALYQRQPQPR